MRSRSTSEPGPLQRDNVLLRRPAITTVVLLATLIVPVAVLPYTLVSRRISRLTNQVDHIVAVNTDLQNVVSKSVHDIALRREELARAISLLKNSKSEIAHLRRDISQTQTQLQSFQSATPIFQGSFRLRRWGRRGLREMGVASLESTDLRKRASSRWTGVQDAEAGKQQTRISETLKYDTKATKTETIRENHI
ncbi:hypothetical protein JVU11DRAFT_4634 [Chiua virens]|nr:hypothetical protein JVU11DRAFT_4634 [Chiua virens]